MGEQIGCEDTLRELEIGAVRERRWRGAVDVAGAGFAALRRSIDELGLIHPVLVRPRAEGGYELVRGARRLAALRDLGAATVTAVVRDLDDREALIGGAWPALLRTGCTAAEAAELHAELEAAGCATPEAEALTAVLDLEPTPTAALAGRPAWAWTPSRTA